MSEMKGTVFALLLLALIGILILYRARRRSRLRSETRTGRSSAAPLLEAPPPVRRPGHMIHPGETGCAAARKIETAWLAGETAPNLPLDDCDHPESCKCRWTRVFDRRQTVRRTDSDRREKIRFEEKPDRRSGVDRRKDSRDPWRQSP